MTSEPIPDFTSAEQELVTRLLLHRYGKPVPLQLADSELQLDAASGELTLCPTLYWSEREAQFVVCKVANSRYRCQFFYSETEQYGTGRAGFDDLENCVTTLLQVQADHERQSPLLSSPMTAARMAGSEYSGPVVI
ncbi:MAG: hypothetical protein HY846_07550 [Nitrosomonadales bacterium]|nr:hypothetical protein [Nitrosomonadales bacterium]